MPGQLQAIQRGIDYQHLWSWFQILALKKDPNVIKVKLEDPNAGFVDDVTVHRNDGAIEFYQIKYHTTLKGHYTLDTLLEVKKGKSLLEKFWITWKKLILTHPKDKIRLILYSNWVAHPDDVILQCINGDDGLLIELFYNQSNDTDCGKQREIWKKKHGATDSEFLEFTNAISFQLGRNFTGELKERVGDRMELVRLKRDENSLIIGSAIVKEWINHKVEDIDLALLESELHAHDLYKPLHEEKTAVTYMVTVKDRQFEVSPDYYLKWQKYFKPVGLNGGHELIESTYWNSVMLPELQALEQKINQETGATLIKARGYARLSPWLAFGHTFSEVSGYQIEVNQQDKLWRTDAKQNADFKMISENGAGEAITGNAKTVAVGISITGSLESDVRSYLETEKSAETLLLLRPERELGNGCFQDAGDVAAFAKQSKEKIREFVKAQKADKLLLFYFGPLSGACFLGHQLNAVCNEIQIMENVPGGYAPSFTLS